MYMFDFYVPTRVHFGSGCLQPTLEKMSDANSVILLVTGKCSMKKAGYTQFATEACECAGARVVLFEGVGANPKTSEINKGIEIGIANGVNVIVGLGGGSVIDAAKAIAVGVGAGEEIDKYFFDEKEVGINTLPIWAIPTTAGTGSELSMGAIISSAKPSIKKGLRSEYIFPRIAIVDPILSVAPDKVTREGGFDVLCHAVETYISLVSSPITEMLSLEAIRLVVSYLPLALKDLNNLEYREKLSYASMIMGINLSNSSTCLPHRMQYPIGAATDTPHSAGLACLYPSWIRASCDSSKEKFVLITNILMGTKETNYSSAQVVDAFINFLQSIKLYIKLSDLGLTLEQVGTFTQQVTGNIKNDPICDIEGIVDKIYIESI